MGGVESTVYLCLSVIPIEFITAGMFVIAAFLAVSTGSSMGTIGTIGPIAIATADTAGLSMPLMVAAVVGGAMFGDNLSMISDTTIAATRTQGVEMRDKFKVNFFIALPPAVITFVLLLVLGRPETATAVEIMDFNIIKVLPYVVVLVLALLGMNVFLTLGSGVILAGIIGIFSGDLTLLSFSSNIYAGFSGMLEIFLLSLFTGGLAHMVTQNGGLQWVLEKIQGMVHSKRSAEVGISAISAIADLAVANNTIAIIISGQIAKGICEEYEVDPRRSASLLDIWSCIFQGFIPYGAQILLACSLTAGVSSGAISPLDLFPLLWYQQLLAVFAIISIFVPFADGIIRKRPWNFKTWQAEDAK